MDYRIAFLQVILLIIVWLVELLLSKVFRHEHYQRHHKHSPIIWTIILWLLSIYNIDSLYWMAYPIAAWMIIAIVLIIGQTIHYNEFIYRRYWSVFWRLSVIIATITFIISLFCQNLPLI
ncbi:DUF3397 family protein [Limosilactobacillus fastidiosus]|uniref:DUF3397 family protein n=1 Tax=Limosilactobacillus fastidiosus TaxID=2759855 RepID=A0A7W3YBH2_9LACO|nr:DUF3397 family protein [Limosilactobacillus fastidiosus]MBB1062367.1 DUF3397 family protein [Limosilactobacillus fastidiosus]MBB1085278.1 DUF3397 family protein [Limosilactobacillus fastidiosus]MCD7083442.1 DUF3397 family protein [Limosilactobacillus fastidiosus]MCD7085262.1 DUF3397 family protein [Limosilactobacillus fastidiosus]MCD7115205.1 DUF3397 family protein [Limosilactobacillus fastidiosus]